MKTDTVAARAWGAQTTAARLVEPGAGGCSTVLCNLIVIAVTLEQQLHWGGGGGVG